MIEVDQIVGAVGIERRLARCRGPARGRIGDGDPLGRDRRCTAERSVIQHFQILADGAAGRFRRQAFFARHRSLPVNIGADKTCIDCEAFAANQPFGHAALDGHLEQLAQQVAVAEAAMPVL